MTHSEAADVIRKAWRAALGRDPSDSELLYSQAIAWLETNYGRAHPFDEWAAQGQFNWGNLERGRLPDGTCPPGLHEGTDSGDKRCFYVFPTDYDAAAAMLKLLTKRWPGVVSAMEGDPEDVAHAMKQAPAYYTATETAYSTALRNAIAAIRAGSPAPKTGPAPSPYPKPGPASAPRELGWGALEWSGALALGAGALYLGSKRLAKGKRS